MTDDERAVPWAEAILDPSNSDLYVVELEGDKVEWEFREAPEFYDEDGNRRDGEQAPKLVKAHYLAVQLRARSKEEAREAALATNPGAFKVTSLAKLKG